MPSIYPSRYMNTRNRYIICIIKITLFSHEQKHAAFESELTTLFHSAEKLYGLISTRENNSYLLENTGSLVMRLLRIR